MTSGNCNSLKKTPKIWWLPSNWKALSTVNCKLWLDLTFPRSVVTASTRYVLFTKLVVVNRLHYSSTPILTSSYWKGTFNRLYFPNPCLETKIGLIGDLLSTAAPWCQQPLLQELQRREDMYSVFLRWHGAQLLRRQYQAERCWARRRRKVAAPCRQQPASLEIWTKTNIADSS